MCYSQPTLGTAEREDLVSLWDRNLPVEGPHLPAAFLKSGSWVLPPGALVHTKPMLLYSDTVAGLGSGFGAPICV